MTRLRARFGRCLVSVLALVSNSPVLPATDTAAPSLAAIEAELGKRAADDMFSGAVLIARGDEVLMHRAYGSADRELKVANEVSTRFRFGSMGKMFTATAIMQLVQSGKLKFDHRLGEIIRDYPNQDVAQVTVEQLLTHTGGTGDIFGPEFLAHREALKTLSDYVKLYGSRGLEFAPGSRHEYSNYGFILLGRIIEVVTGQRYEDYVRDHIFSPVGMSSTDNQPESSHVDHLAIGYTRAESLQGPRRQRPSEPKPNEAWQRADGTLPYRGTSAGGGYSTVEDLLKFARAIASHRLLNAKLTDAMTTGNVDTPWRGLRYAYGFEDATTPAGARRIGHGGGAPGMNGVLWMYPESGYVIVLLANLDPPAAQDAARFIERTLAIQ